MERAHPLRAWLEPQRQLGERVAELAQGLDSASGREGPARCDPRLAPEIVCSSIGE